jgi:hypothetical protein
MTVPQIEAGIQEKNSFTLNYFKYAAERTTLSATHNGLAIYHNNRATWKKWKRAN